MWRTLHAQHHVSQMQQCGFTRLAGCVVHHIFFREHAKTKNLARHSMKKASLQPKDHPGSETGMPATTERLGLMGQLVHHMFDMAGIMGQRLLEIVPNDDSVYLMLYNVYSVVRNRGVGKKDVKVGLRLD